MGKTKKGITVNASSSSEANELGKLSKKELGKQIQGSPTEWDVKNIQVLIDTYEKAFPGRLSRMASDYRLEVASSSRRKDFGVISEASEMRQTMWMPQDLEQVLEASYPSIWANKKHQYWFLRHFPIFKGAEKI